jgi:hypothetical protein
MSLNNNYHVLMDLNYVLTRILIKIYLTFIINYFLINFFCVKNILDI